MVGEPRSRWLGRARATRHFDPGRDTLKPKANAGRPLTTSSFKAGAAAWSPGVAAELVLHDLLDRELGRASTVAQAERRLFEDLRAAVTGGGKRLRPTFCHWGHVGACGESPDASGAQLGAALELLHTFALVHDDVMDGSESRRGQPAVHARYAAEHERGDLAGDGRRFGDGMAILVGDLAFALANRLVGGLGEHVGDIWYAMCGELVRGQYLDLAGTAGRVRSLPYAARVASLKSGRYTVVRPLQLGAAAAGRTDAALHDAYEAYGEPLGQAFQLRDDLLGVFGDPVRTGKPVGADLRDGKPTVLLAIVVERAPRAAKGLLDRIGTPGFDDDDVEAVVALAEDTGARYEVSRLIAAAVADARDALEAGAIHAAAQPALLGLTDQAAWRDA